MSANGQITICFDGRNVDVNPNTPGGANSIRQMFESGRLTDTAIDTIRKSLKANLQDPNTDNGSSIISKLVGITSSEGSPLYAHYQIEAFIRIAKIDLTIKHIPTPEGLGEVSVMDLTADSLNKSAGLRTLEAIEGAGWIKDSLRQSIEFKKDEFFYGKTGVGETLEIAIKESLGLAKDVPAIAR